MESRFRYYNHALIPVSPEVTKFDSKLGFFDAVKEYKEGLRKTGGGASNRYTLFYIIRTMTVKNALIGGIR